MEKLLGFKLNWYVNQADGKTLSIGFLWDRLPLPAKDKLVSPEYERWGMRLAALDSDTLIGYEAGEDKVDAAANLVR